jgi:hypothetical protein
MNKQEWDNSLLEHFAPKKGGLNLDLLMEMVAEVMESAPVLSEESAPTGEITDKAMEQMLLKMIPDIAVSEIGWSDVRTVTKDGKEESISGPQRKLLEDYLSNIDGKDFAEKIAGISRFYSDGAEVIREQSSDDRTKNIVQAISYLVFYKTLTKVVTHFNASSAGFSFESFLATLVNGYQIEANTGTIADYVDRATGKDIPVSLKLYKEKKLEVGGSYNDLVKDLVDPQFGHPLGNAMRYVICTKEFTGEGLEQTGKIRFWQFDFTLENVMNILVNSKDLSKECIRLPRKVVEALGVGVERDELTGDRISGSQLLGIPEKQVMKSPEELEKIFISKLRGRIEIKQQNPDSLFRLIDEAAFKSLVQNIDWAKDDSLFKPIEVKNPLEPKGDTIERVVHGRSLFIASKINAKATKWVESYANDMSAKDPESPWAGLVATGFASDLYSEIRNANQGPRQKEGTGRSAIPIHKNPMDDPQAGVLATQAASAKEKLRTQMIDTMKESGELMTPEESAEAYSKLKDPEKMKYALKNSLGNLKNLHFSMNQTQATAKETKPHAAKNEKGEEIMTKKGKTIMLKGGAGAIKIGEIQVGTAHVVKALEGVRTILNEEVGEIFKSLKVLSDSLNSYFAGGLENDDLASLATENAETISTAKTLETEK